MIPREITESVITIASLIIAVLTLSVILSPKAKTTSVIQAAGSAFSNAMAVAASPVTGASVSINTAYPADNSFGGIGMPDLSGVVPGIH